MSGKTEFFPHCVLALSLLVIFTDLAWGRIFNWITFSAAFLGLVFSGVLLGWAGLGDSFLGFVVGFLLYGWLFWFRVIGGGDVKLLMALGALGGLKYAEQVGLLAILLGGLMAAALLLVRGKLPDFLRRMRDFFMVVFVRELQVAPPRVDSKMKMPFGIPISIAAVWIAYGQPFEKWGIRLWN